MFDLFDLNSTGKYPWRHRLKSWKSGTWKGLPSDWYVFHAHQLPLLQITSIFQIWSPRNSAGVFSGETTHIPGNQPYKGPHSRTQSEKGEAEKGEPSFFPAEWIHYSAIPFFYPALFEICINPKNQWTLQWRGLTLYEAGFWDIQTTSFEILWVLG